MGKLCDTMKQASTDVWHWFFPKKIDVPDCVIELLKAIYPTVDWDKVTFYEGLPNLFGLPTLINNIFGGGGLSQGAITLPSTKSLSGINVYLIPSQSDWCSCNKDLNTYVHEGAHVLQIQEWLGGWGLGMGRPFITLYLACFFDNFSYSNSPFEIPAYQIESTFVGCCSTSPCDCSTTPPTTNTTAITDLVNNCTGLVQTSSGMNFWEMVAQCAPGIEYLLEGAKWVSETFCKPFKNLNSKEWAVDASKWILSVLCTRRKENTENLTDMPVSKLPPDVGDMQPPENEPRPGKVNWWAIFCILGIFGAGLIWVGYGLWWALRGLLCGLGWVLAGVLYAIYGIYYAVWLIFWSLISIVAEIFFLIVELLGVIITGIMWIITGILCALEWIWEKLKELWDWFMGVLEKVCDWSVELEQKCAEWETERKRECTEERDEGYNECTRTRDDGYNECTETRDEGYNECCDWWPCSWACSAWVWVSNIVCVAWTWVSNIVCVAWTWVSNVVCVAWTWIVSKSCKAFTWVVKKITCW